MKELARALGVDASQVSHFRAGRRIPDVVEVAEICRALGVSADWLLGLEERKAPAGANTPAPADLARLAGMLDAARVQLAGYVDEDAADRAAAEEIVLGVLLGKANKRAVRTARGGS